MCLETETIPPEKKRASLLLPLVSGFLLSACHTTGDPHADTIFWSRQKAQQRLQDRQSVLQEENAALAAQIAEKQALQGKISETAAAVSALENQCAQIEAEVDRLLRTPSSSRPRGKEVEKLELRLAELQQQTAAAQEENRYSAGAVQEYAQELESLKRRLTACHARVQLLLKSAP